MMRSLYSGVAGLKTHQTKMDVLGNNIANVNTTSYKSQSITFSDLMYQTTQAASGATEYKGGINARQIGLGAKSGAIATAIEGQGATQTTNNPFDIMITGKAFFVVSNGTTKLYTRDGSFYVDGAGNLAMQSNGYFVLGWEAKENAETGEIEVNKNGEISQLKIMTADNTNYPPASTIAGLVSGNIDDHDSNVVSDDGKTVTLEIYDNKGYLYTCKFNIKDTDTDQLFSLELTDIIDSNGNTIGKELLKGVTLGDADSESMKTAKDYENGYSLVVSSTDPTQGTIYLDSGFTAFDNVPATGDTISSLTNINGFMKTIYPDAIAKRYANIDSYEIDQDALNVTFDYSDYSSSIINKTYTSFIKNNTEAYYYDKITQFGYAAPSIEGGKLSSLNKEMLTEVFEFPGTNAAYQAMLDDASNYVYEFDEVNLTIKSGKVPEETDEYVSGSKLKTKYDNYFTNADGSANKISDVVGNIDLTTYPKGAWYTYSNDTLKIYGAKSQVKTDGNESITALTSSKLYAYLKQYELDNGVLPDTMDLSTLPTTVQTEVKNMLTTEDIIDSTIVLNLSQVSLTGTTGTTVGVTFSYNDKEITDPDYLLGTFNIVSEQIPADPTNKFQYDVPTSVFRDVATKKTGYVLFDDDPSGFSLDEIPDNILQTVYKTSKASIKVKNKDTSSSVYPDDFSNLSDEEFNVSFTTSGKMTITHKQTDSVPINSDYECSVDNGVATFKTANATVAFPTDTSEGSTFSLKGKISDILSTANTTTKGLLEKAFGLTDADARAYGSNGYYEIDEIEGIKLYTKDPESTDGNKTITLKFDPKTGKIVNANGNESTFKVNMMFDQSIPGLEPFGYQDAERTQSGKQNGQLELDFSTVTNFNTNGSSTIRAVKGDKNALNTGRAVGTMNGVTVSTDGSIYATYSNGQTKLLGQIASAEFANASGLSKEGDNLYASTLNSGEATIQDITSDGGYMNTGVLEMSNVDLSSQFTEMITTQRGFQANSRIITVSDTLLEELTNLKR